MIVSLTGTPGTGKTTVGKLLEKQGIHTIELGDLIKEKKLYVSFDAERDSYDVDPEILENEIKSMKISDDCILIGHLSHLISSDMIIVLRCRPAILHERLKLRNWKESKIRENLEAEALDVILVESTETDAEVFEINTTEMTAEEVSEAVLKIMSGDVADYALGNIDWSEEVLEWY